MWLSLPPTPLQKQRGWQCFISAQFCLQVLQTQNVSVSISVRITGHCLEEAAQRCHLWCCQEQKTGRLPQVPVEAHWVWNTALGPDPRAPREASPPTLQGSTQRCRFLGSLVLHQQQSWEQSSLKSLASTRKLLQEIFTTLEEKEAFTNFYINWYVQSILLQTAEKLSGAPVTKHLQKLQLVYKE